MMFLVFYLIASALIGSDAVFFNKFANSHCKCIPKNYPCVRKGYRINFNFARTPSACLPNLILCCDEEKRGFMGSKNSLSSKIQEQIHYIFRGLESSSSERNNKKKLSVLLGSRPTKIPSISEKNFSITERTFNRNFKKISTPTVSTTPTSKISQNVSNDFSKNKNTNLKYQAHTNISHLGKPFSYFTDKLLKIKIMESNSTSTEIKTNVPQYTHTYENRPHEQSLKLDIKDEKDNVKHVTSSTVSHKIMENESVGTKNFSKDLALETIESNMFHKSKIDEAFSQDSELLSKKERVPKIQKHFHLNPFTPNTQLYKNIDTTTPMTEVTLPSVELLVEMKTPTGEGLAEVTTIPSVEPLAEVTSISSFAPQAEVTTIPSIAPRDEVITIPNEEVIIPPSVVPLFEVLTTIPLAEMVTITSIATPGTTEQSEGTTPGTTEQSEGTAPGTTEQSEVTTFDTTEQFEGTTPGTIERSEVTTPGTIERSEVTTLGTTEQFEVTTPSTTEQSKVTTTGTTEQSEVTTLGSTVLPELTPGITQLNEIVNLGTIMSTAQNIPLSSIDQTSKKIKLPISPPQVEFKHSGQSETLSPEINNSILQDNKLKDIVPFETKARGPYSTKLFRYIVHPRSTENEPDLLRVYNESVDELISFSKTLQKQSYNSNDAAKRSQSTNTNLVEMDKIEKAKVNTSELDLLNNTSIRNLTEKSNHTMLSERAVNSSVPITQNKLANSLQDINGTNYFGGDSTTINSTAATDPFEDSTITKIDQNQEQSNSIFKWIFNIF